MSLEAVLNAKRNWHVERCDVLDGLRMLPDGCVNAVVTSPPYYALRSYLPADHADKAKEHGSEPTPEAFIATMVAVFEEVRRVLRDDGVCWVNLGDSYASTWNCRRTNKVGNGSPSLSERCDTTGGTLKEGDKLNMPHRVASALQAAGWWWRDTVVWHKLSPMPESVAGWKWVRCRVKVGNATMRLSSNEMHRPRLPENGNGFVSPQYGKTAQWSPCPGCPKCEPNGGWVLRRGKWRCTQSHEYIFQFAKSAEYFCDGEAAKQPHTEGTLVRFGKNNSLRSAGPRSQIVEAGEVRANGSFKSGLAAGIIGGANPRNVWSLPHEPTSEKHFAAYPTEVVRRCLLPSLAHAYCAACGAPHAPMVVEERKATRPALANKIWKHDDGDHVGQRSDDSPNLDPERHIKCSTVVGYRATCGCNAGTTTGLVLDPYCGTGTTGEVALKLGARFIGFELNDEYKRMADRRVKKKLPLFA